VLLCGVLVVELGGVEFGLFLRERFERPLVPVWSVVPGVLLVVVGAVGSVGVVAGAGEGEELLFGSVVPGMVGLVGVLGLAGVVGLAGIVGLVGVVCDGFVGVVCCAKVSELPSTSVAAPAVKRVRRSIVNLPLAESPCVRRRARAWFCLLARLGLDAAPCTRRCHAAASSAGCRVACEPAFFGHFLRFFSLIAKR
jgi:hypothetical protein